MPKLTDTYVHKLAAPERDYRIEWCSATPGFGLRITSAGAKAWIVERRVQGRTVRRTLGRVHGHGRNALTAEAARKAAVVLSGELAQGKDRLTEVREEAKHERLHGLTFATALTDYLNDRELKPRTRADYEGMVQSAEGRRAAGELASIADTRLDRLTGAGIKDLYRKLQARGPTRAAYSMRVLRAVLNHHGLRLDVDPFARSTPGRDRVRLPSANRRTRIVPPERMAAWWKAANKTENGDNFQLLLLTGMRRGELIGVQLEDVDLDGGRIILRDAKTGSRVVLLSRQAQRIVAARAKRCKRPKDFLFEADPRGALKAIIAATGVEFSPHDLRRTFGTIAAGLLPGYVVKALLGHAAGADVTAAHYVHLDESTLRAAWQRVADEVSK